ncbi:MAG: flagellar motor protein MotB [Phenylobacterium sp.]|nr:flagellar motor protein MotB [Phenylobacterium sp.]
MRALLPLALLALLGGCASRGAVTLLPGEAGAPAGAVVVFDGKTQAERGVLDRENTQAALGRTKLKARSVKAELYAALASLMPPPAHHFTVYFLEGSTDLAPGSEPVLDQMIQELALRSGAEVEIIGHTDTVGSDADNDSLSLKRAEEIRDALVAKGRLDVAITGFAGRGERELLVPTADNVDEPRNRRVEIVVR